MTIFVKDVSSLVWEQCLLEPWSFRAQRLTPHYASRVNHGSCEPERSYTQDYEKNRLGFKLVHQSTRLIQFCRFPAALAGKQRQGGPRLPAREEHVWVEAGGTRVA